VDKLVSRPLPNLEAKAYRRELRHVVERLCDIENPLLNRMERERLIDEVLGEALGFGPLEGPFHDPKLQEIEVHGIADVRVRRNDAWEATDVAFNDRAHLQSILHRIVARSLVPCAELKCGASVEALLPNGFRAHITMPAQGGEDPAVRLWREGHTPDTTDSTPTRYVGPVVSPPPHLVDQFRRLFPCLVRRLHGEGYDGVRPVERGSLRETAIQITQQFSAAEEVPLNDEDQAHLVRCLLAAFSC
jgi:hypothetical protein